MLYESVQKKEVRFSFRSEKQNPKSMYFRYTCILFYLKIAIGFRLKINGCDSHFVVCFPTFHKYLSSTMRFEKECQRVMKKPSQISL